MKRLIFLVLALICVQQLEAQIIKPVKWSYAAKRTSANEATLFIKATIYKGWHIYSTKQAEGGPRKTVFAFDGSKDFTLVGGLTEPIPISRFEKVFEMKVLFFENTVVFTQKIKLNAARTVVKGTVEFMVCNDRECLPPDEVAFSIPLK